MNIPQIVLRGLAYAWAAPYTAVGLVFGLCIILFGGSGRARQGALEFGGGALGTALSRMPAPFSFAAITLGHVVLGLDHSTLAAVRVHERVHIRQYERWGPFFVPAYLAASLVELLRGRRPYRDNWFEREAYGKAAQGADARRY